MGGGDEGAVVGDAVGDTLGDVLGDMLGDSLVQYAACALNWHAVRVPPSR